MYPSHIDRQRKLWETDRILRTIIPPTEVRYRAFLLVVFRAILLLVVERVETCTLDHLSCLGVCKTARVEDRIVGAVVRSPAESQVALDAGEFKGRDRPWHGKLNILYIVHIAVSVVNCPFHRLPSRLLCIEPFLNIDLQETLVLACEPR